MTRANLLISQFGYLEKVVDRFRISDAKIVGTLLDHHIKLSVMERLKSMDDNQKKMKKIYSTPYEIR